MLTICSLFLPFFTTKTSRSHSSHSSHLICKSHLSSLVTSISCWKSLQNSLFHSKNLRFFLSTLPSPSSLPDKLLLPLPSPCFIAESEMRKIGSRPPYPQPTYQLFIPFRGSSDQTKPKSQPTNQCPVMNNFGE